MNLGREEQSAGGVGALEAFVQAAEEYGVGGIEYQSLPDNTEVMTQPQGLGWHAISYSPSRHRLQLGLTPTFQTTEEDRQNGTSTLNPDLPHRGITLGTNGGLSVDHPIARLYEELSRWQGVGIYITGEHAGWKIARGTQLNPTRDEQGNLISLVGYIPGNTQLKAVITNVDAKWEEIRQCLTIKSPRKPLGC